MRAATSVAPRPTKWRHDFVSVLGFAPRPSAGRCGTREPSGHQERSHDPGEDELRRSTVPRRGSLFHGQLLGTNGLDSLIRNADYYPSFKAGMGSLYRRSTSNSSTTSSGRTREISATLLSAPFSFVNESLAAVYGMSGVSGIDFRKVPLDTNTGRAFPAGEHPLAHHAWEPNQSSRAREVDLYPDALRCGQ